MKSFDEVKKEVLNYLEENTLKSEEDICNMQQDIPELYVEYCGGSGRNINEKFYVVFYDSHCDGGYYDDFEEITQIYF